MTIGEVLRQADGINYRMKISHQYKANFDYVQVNLLGQLLEKLFDKNNNSKFPTLQEAYPDLFDMDDEAIEEANTINSIANFKNFANAFNAKFKKGGQDGGRNTKD